MFAFTQICSRGFEYSDLFGAQDRKYGAGLMGTDEVRVELKCRFNTPKEMEVPSGWSEVGEEEFLSRVFR